MAEKHECCSQTKCCWDTALKHFKGTTLSHTMHLCTCQFLSQIQDLPSPEFPASHPPQEILHFFQVSTQTSPESLRQSETVHPTSLITLYFAHGKQNYTCHGITCLKGFSRMINVQPHNFFKYITEETILYFLMNSHSST